MQATHTYLNSNKTMRTPAGQRGFFTVAIGLAMTALLGATSAVIVSTHEEKPEVSVASQLPADALEINTVSAAN